MAWKYRKRISVFPGFRLNLSKSGVSATVGIKGFNVNMGKNGSFVNAGLPGTGIYDRIKLDSKTVNNQIQQENQSKIPDDMIEIKSYQPDKLTSDGLFGLKESIINARKTKEELKINADEVKSKMKKAQILMVVSYIFIIGIFVKWFKENYISLKADAEDAEETYGNFKLDIDFDMDSSIKSEYSSLKNCFNKLSASAAIWDITGTRSNDRVKTRSLAKTSMQREPVSFNMETLEYISSKYEAMKLHNSAGGDILIYPGFVIMANKKNSNDFGIIEFRDIKIGHSDQNFIECESVPRNTIIVGKTWKYVNANGKPDKRFKDNPEYPIALYYKLTLETTKGFNEWYLFSNQETGKRFCEALLTYRDSLVEMKWSVEATKSD